MKKTESLPSTSALFTCTCGAMPYDAEKRPKGKVGLARYRKSSRYASDGGWSVAYLLWQGRRARQHADRCKSQMERKAVQVWPAEGG